MVSASNVLGGIVPSSADRAAGAAGAYRETYSRWSLDRARRGRCLRRGGRMIVIIGTAVMGMYLFTFGEWRLHFSPPGAPNCPSRKSPPRARTGGKREA